MNGQISIIPIRGIPQISPGDDIASHILASGETLLDGDVIVVTQKIVSKAENRIVKVDPDDPHSHIPYVLKESRRILRLRGQLLITETRQGFVCANAGVDRSNLEPDQAALLPIDSDKSANTIRSRIEHILKIRVGVIISDTFGRAWRRGLTDVAIGCSGIGAILDLKGTRDALGRELQVTEVCIADEVAGAAELVMGKAEAIPVAIVRGLDPSWLRESSCVDEIIRPPQEDLFR